MELQPQFLVQSLTFAHASTKEFALKKKTTRPTVLITQKDSAFFLVFVKMGTLDHSVMRILMPVKTISSHAIQESIASIHRHLPMNLDSSAAPVQMVIREMDSNAQVKQLSLSTNLVPMDF